MSSQNDNQEDGTDRFALDRRRFFQAAASIGLLSGTAAGQSTYQTTDDDNDGDGDGGGGDGNGGGGDGNGGGGDGNGGSGSSEPVSVTLVTGQTIHVTEGENGRTFSVDADERGSFHVAETEAGTYVVPTGVDLDRFSESLFNVDSLIEQGLTDAETDGVPVIVRLATDSVSARSGPSIRSTAGFTPDRTLESIGAVSGTVEKSAAGVATANALESDAVEKIHLDATYEAELDTSTGAIDVPAARDAYGVDGSGVSIAVCDTGIDTDHPDVGDRVVHQEDFSGDGVEDGQGHGTHVAGIAAGDGTESDGEYVGVAPGADLLNVKVLDNSGSGALSDIVAGIEHAVDQGADVMNLSLGGPVQEDDPMEAAIDAAADAGVVATVSSGNNYGHDSISSPGHAAGAITVGATDDADGSIASFSSGGPTPYDYRVKPDVVAPGAGITASGSGDAGEAPYTEKSGTSMSAPHVAGLSALLLERDAGRGPEDVRDALVSTANPIEGEDVFIQGGGEVDAPAALESDLRVHETVINFGLYDEETTDAAEITLENVGDDAVDVDASATLENVQSGDAYDDSVSVTPATLSIAPGETATLELEIETGAAFGWNSGYVTVDVADGESYNSVFGFVYGVEVTVEKLAHEDSSSVEGDYFSAWAHDGSFSHSSFAAFDADGQHSFLLLGDGGEFTFWSSGELDAEEGELSGEPTLTVESGVTIDADDAHVTMDEGETVPRELDTGQIDDHAPFGTREFNTTLFGHYDGGSLSYGAGYTGDFGLFTAHVSPIDEADPTTLTSDFLFFPADTVGEYTLDSSTVYNLLYGTESIDAGDATIEVETDELAAENLAYHRDYENQLLGLAPHLWHADFDTYPLLVSFGFTADISDSLDEQTWYRTEQTVYDESWYDDASFVSGNWRYGRMESFVPDPGAEYHHQFNREPLFDHASAWSLEDGTLEATANWYADQAADKFQAYAFDSGNPNEYAVTVDGEEIGSGTTVTDSVSLTVDELEPGSSIGVSTRGNTLVDTDRGTTTVTDWNGTYDGRGDDAPPQLDSVDVLGLNRLNTVPAGHVPIAVETSEPVSDFEAMYAPSGTVETTPFEDETGWAEADVVFGGGWFGHDDRFGVAVDAAGLDAIDLAFAAADGTGDGVETTTFEAVSLGDGAEVAVDAEVPQRIINPDSKGPIVVVIEPTEDVDVDDIDADTLRFGAPAAVTAGDGASPITAHRIGRGRLLAKFRANETGYECDRTETFGLLTGELDDGTAFTGIDDVWIRCSGWGR